MIRRLYGAGALHAVLMVGAAIVIGYAAVRWAQIGLRQLAVWLGGSVVAHDLLLVPAYAVADRLLVRVLRRRSWLVNYVRVPTALALLLLAVWWPLVLDRVPARVRQSGSTAEPFLSRWLAVSAALFLISAVLAVVAVVRRRRGE